VTYIRIRKTPWNKIQAHHLHPKTLQDINFTVFLQWCVTNGRGHFMKLQGVGYHNWQVPLITYSWQSLPASEVVRPVYIEVHQFCIG